LSKLSYIAIDIGATNIRVATGDHNGLRRKIVRPTDIHNGSDGVSTQIIKLIESVRTEEPSAIGIGSIGPIDLEKGMITNTPNYPLQNIPIEEPLVEEYKVPVTIVNDCAAAVMGEQMFGAGQGMENLVYVTISTGLGAGAIVDDNLLLGKDGNAVEAGHFTVYPDSDIVCGCGCRGHWEAFCSGKNIPKYVRSLLDSMDWNGSELYELAGGKPDNITAKSLYTAANQGDAYSLDIVARIGEINAIGFANIVNAYDPELITVGGSIALNNHRLVLDPIRDNIQKHTINRVPEIKITLLGQDAVIIGALALAMQI
jgi:glucokinase